MNKPRRTWDVRTIDPERTEQLAAELNVPTILATMLGARGMDDREGALRFLHPTLADLPEPYSMLGLAGAVARLEEAIKAGEQVCIFGDYDVDGVTSTAVLLLFLRQVGLPVEYYIPSRQKEGYGLSETVVREIAERGIGLLITVDCGISDVAAITVAREVGLDVIVIDHHQIPAVLPAAVAILNPRQSDCQFPDKELAAVGVVFELVVALRASLRSGGFFQNRSEPNLREYLDLVCLGTVADMVPLVGTNRILTHFGLRELAAGRRPGIAALKEVAGVSGEETTVGQVAFRLAPRINAIGRLDQAAKAVELLTTQSYRLALTLARELDQANAERQAIEQEIFDDAIRQAEEQLAQGAVSGLVLASEDWHVGVVGIVASRLVERFGCPVALVALTGEECRGSARGTEDIHLYECLQACADTLLAFGGHSAAAGLTIQRGMLDDFRRAFVRILDQRCSKDESRKLWIDAELQPAGLTFDLISQLNQLAPYGIGNPEPIFKGSNLEVKTARLVGNKPPFHVRGVVLDNGHPCDAIGFRLGDRLEEFRGYVDLAYTPEFNEFNGQTTIQLRVIDLKRSD
jgi:single-stranded-DNA-specific exonuclease